MAWQSGPRPFPPWSPVIPRPLVRFLLAPAQLYSVALHSYPRFTFHATPEPSYTHSLFTHSKPSYAPPSSFVSGRFPEPLPFYLQLHARAVHVPTAYLLVPTTKHLAYLLPHTHTEITLNLEKHAYLHPMTHEQLAVPIPYLPVPTYNARCLTHTPSNTY